MLANSCLVAVCASVAGGAPTVVRTTLPEARAAVSAARASAEAARDGVIVEITGGTYRLEEPVVLAPADGGTADAPVVWRAAPGEQVIVSGGKAIDKWRPVSDPAVRARLHEASRDHIVVADLKAAGVEDFGRIEQRGSPGMELFFRGRRMPLARYPNDGWLLVAGVPQDGPVRFNEGLEREKRFDGVPVGRHYGRINYPDERPSRWAPDNGILAHGYWVWDWNDSFQRIQSINPQQREITFAEPHHHYGYARNQRFRFLNVLEELDEPGEWYLDRAAGLVYFHPPSELAPGSVEVSTLAGPILALDGASHLSIEGMTFEHSRGGGVLIKGGSDCRIAGSTFRELGGEALEINGGSRNRVVSCDFHDLATGAIRVSGGDRAQLTPSGHEIVNNHIHDISQWLRTGQYGVFIDGVGQRIANNRIHDAPFEAMYLRGNDHFIEYNDVYRVCTETGDAGAIHTGRDYTWQGNVIRFNYWHDLKGPGLHGVTAVYLDDFSSGFVIHGNVFHRAGRAVQLGGGRDNTVTNNLFVDCDPSVHLDARGLTWAHYYFNGTFNWLFDRFRDVSGDQPPYSIRYPRLRTLMQDEPPVPKGNVIRANISWGPGRWMDVYDFHDFDFHGLTTMRDNLVANTGFMRRRAVADGKPDPYYLNIDGVDGYALLRTDDPSARSEFGGNELAADPPGTFQADRPGLSLNDPSMASGIGFEQLPFHLMGLRIDEWRTEIPGR